MDYCCGCDEEGEKEVEGKESGEGCIVYRKASSNSLDEGVADIGDGG